jgi:hypothetical protein
LFPTGLAVTIAVPISTSGNSALLIGAGYMIVNELALDPGGLGSEAAFLPTSPSCSTEASQPNARGGILVSPRLECVENGVGVLCEGDAADSKKELTVTPQAFMGSTQDHQRWQDHRDGGVQDKNSWLLTPRHRQRVQGRLPTSNFP